MRILSAVFALVLAMSAAAQQPNVATLQKENATLRQRVDKLENELAQIKAMLAEKGVSASGATTPAKKSVLSSVDLELYGFVKLDAAHDGARTSTGNYGRWVESDSTFADDDQFSLTANQTRLGLRLTGPTDQQLRLGGLVEVDFYGGGAENKPNPMMRHAYLTAFWPELGLSVLAGQTADTVSPLVMPTVNYTVGWWQGDIGYRRPQLRLTKTALLGDKVEAKLEVAAARTIGRTNSFTGANYDTGQESGLPTLQGRASVSVPLAAGKPMVAGVSGHWGQEEMADGNTLDTWSLNFDLMWPLTKKLSLQAEAYMGDNLEAYLGGVGQGVNGMQVVYDVGGWVALSLAPSAQWQFNVGAGLDNPSDNDLADGGRTYNSVVFGNVWYFFNPNFLIGFELSHLHTGYRNLRDGESLREQLSLMYKF